MPRASAMVPRMPGSARTRQCSIILAHSLTPRQLRETEARGASASGCGRQSGAQSLHVGMRMVIAGLAKDKVVRVARVKARARGEAKPRAREAEGAPIQSAVAVLQKAAASLGHSVMKVGQRTARTICISACTRRIATRARPSRALRDVLGVLSNSSPMPARRIDARLLYNRSVYTAYRQTNCAGLCCTAFGTNALGSRTWNTEVIDCALAYFKATISASCCVACLRQLQNHLVQATVPSLEPSLPSPRVGF
mmetsp:Transcript_48468/g.134771  ORF Transcript_48468/g.134771 Transcript_48468/m.134771 type:complete len:252 (+) Transcript_48468:502-1257(+)